MDTPIISIFPLHISLATRFPCCARWPRLDSSLGFVPLRFSCAGRLFRANGSSENYKKYLTAGQRSRVR
jgi:hypothetical protein